MKKNYLLIPFFFFICFYVHSQELISYRSVNNTGCSGTIINNPDVTGTGICRGPGIMFETGTNYTSDGWSTTTTINFTDYLEWSVEATPGNNLDLSSMRISYASQSVAFGSGPSSLQIRVDYGTGFIPIFSDNNVPTAQVERVISLNSIPPTNNTITFRLYAFDASNSAYDFEILETSLGLNKGITINGTVISQNCADLFISEYIEGSGNNKYIEIYNPTNLPVAMNQYDLAIYFNGSTIAGQTIPLSGFISPYDVYIVENSGETLGVSANLSTTQLNFNGDDAVGLRKIGTIIDVIGEIGFDPGSEWNDATCSQGTQNGTLVRNSTVQIGDDDGSNVFVPSDEWTCFAEDDVSNLGSHFSDCQGPTPEIQLVDNSATNQNCGYTIDFGNVANDGSFSDITFDISNVGSDILTISNLQIFGDYAFIAPPPTPFNIAPSNSVTLTVRFQPTSNGTLAGLVRIFNNDSNEGVCEIDLTGIGFTPAPEIDIERNTGASIPDGSAANIGFNTIFAATVIGNASAPKTYFVSNEGTGNLNLSSITSSNPAEFSINSNPSPASIAPSAEVDFEITFSPTGIGIRTATITIVSDDADENPYTFNVQGNGDCAAGALTFLPDNGPVNTIVNVTTSSTNFGGSTTATINGLTATVNVISNSELELIIPPGASTGTLEITDDLGCISFNVFTVIDEQISSCEGNSGSAPTDLFISEVTDHGSGSHSYVEIYNGTGATINLTDYEIRIHNNGSTTPTNTIPLGGSVLNNDVFVLAFGAGDATNPYSTHGFDQSDSASGINEDDNIRLYFTPTNTWIDVWGDTSGNTFTVASRDYTYRRKNSGITAPNTYGDTTWDPNDWDSFTPVDYNDIGTYDFSTGIPPTVSNINSATTACNEVTISVTALEGFAGNNPLAYVWYAYDPAQSGLGWQPITNGGIYSGANTANLVITDAVSVADYQFYCQVREDDASCFTASDAVQITISTATWDGTNWIPAAPTLNTIAILNEDYDTNIDGGSFSCCSLVINSNWELRVSNTTYVEVETDVIVENNASIIVETQGSFVQNGDGANAGSFTLNGTAFSQVNKTTSPLANWYNYTYWSSPVLDADVDMALGFSAPDRRFYFDANNFNSTIVPDIDDEGDDWTLATGTGIMVPGRGYAATHSPIGFVSGNQYEYNFEGALNTGDILYPIVNNPINSNHWNLVGNPYPSAIKVRGIDGLFNGNSGVIDQVVYLWSHSSPPLGTNPGNQNLNFNTSDYATINASMSVPGSSGITPGNYIPSGQSFFVRSLANGNISFANSMRIVGNNSNDLFFRQPMESSSNDKELLRINLTSEEGIFSALGVAYTAHATDSYDGMGYDTKRNFTSGYPAFIYSRIPNQDHKFVIQSKQISSLDINETIPLGLKVSIDEALIYSVSLGEIEGAFLTTNPIFLKDNVVNTLHNLKESDYNFTSEVGEFNDRFEIVFQDSALSIEEFEVNANDLRIVELTNGNVEFRVGKNLTIKEVVILDVVGREIYRLPGSSALEVYNLDKLSQAPYIAQVELSNRHIITKKAIKRN